MVSPSAFAVFRFNHQLGLRRPLDRHLGGPWHPWENAQLLEIPYTDIMKSTELPVIPVSPDTAARYASLSEEQKRTVRMRVAIEIGRLSRRKSRAESAAELRAATATNGNKARRKGLSLSKLKRMIDGSG